MPDPQLLALLDSGTRRLVRSVDALSHAEWSQPSLLPGWSRAHVVAHLTLNAEALAGVLGGVRERRAVAMYASDEVRDGAIEELAAAEPAALRDRFLASTAVLAERVAELADDSSGVRVERTPGGRRFAAGDVPSMRVREVEIHHADLGVGYTAEDWTAAFVVLLLSTRAAAQPPGPGFVAHAVDLDERFVFGDGGATVSGPGHALAWWATGRGTGAGLTSDDGHVPRMEPW